MHARGVDGMNRVHAVHHRRNDRPGQLVNDLAETGVFLRRPAHHGERPDRIGAMPDLFHVQHRKRMLEAVVAEMIAERALGQLQVRIDDAA